MMIVELMMINKILLININKNNMIFLLFVIIVGVCQMDIIPVRACVLNKGYFFHISQFLNNSNHSSVTYPGIRRCGVSCRRCGRECGGCAPLKEMMHPQWKTTASPEGDAAFPNSGICDTAPKPY
jgi:hypothetical protein